MNRFALALLCCALPTATHAGTAIDWRKAAFGDIEASRATLLADSPGGASGVDAQFLAAIDRATDLARADAQKVNSYAGYRFALERFANMFQDDHLWVDFEDSLPAKWPGFLVGYRTSGFEVVDSKEAGVPLGAKLEQCDGTDAQALAARNLSTYVGRWSVPSSRRQVAPYLLIDRGNPFIARPAHCTFSDGAKNWSVDLKWTDIARDDLNARLGTAQRIGTQPDGGIRATEDGGYWVGIPTLNAMNPEAVAGLEALMKDIEARAPAIRNARYFVIDLRGNSGGNTFVALRVLNAIWGEGTVSDAKPKNLRAEWRASEANLAYLQAVQPMLKQMFGENSVASTGLGKVVEGFQHAIAAHEPLYVDPDEYSILGAAASVHHDVKAKPFLLTDGACESSCLNLVDIVRKLPNVEQIGDETGSDTNFLENKAQPLPSGKAVLQFPIKHYRNRERLANEAYKPDAYWKGDMSDTAGLEHWIAALADR